MVISQIAYELYKQEWIREHTTPEIRSQAVQEYEEFVRECMNDGLDPGSYEEYLEEYGFDGALYVCYEEFCDMEYHDVEYIQHLLGGDEALLKQYFDDVEAGYGEAEDLLVVSEVLSAAERRRLACAVRETGAFEQVLD